MGRALLIICLMSFIILGLVQQRMNHRHVNLTEGNVQTFLVNSGRNATGSGLELGIHRIAWDNNWQSLSLPWQFSIQGHNVNVWVDTHDTVPADIPAGFLRVRSELVVEGRAIESVAWLQQGSLEIPHILGALGVYGTGSRLNLGGNPLKISGFDTNPDGSPGPEPALPGIISPDSESDLIHKSGNPHHVPYEGNPGYVQQPMDGTEVLKLVNMYKSIGTWYTSDSDLGTPDNPKITIIDGEVDLDGGTENGGGIIVVTDTGRLRMRGNYTFEGLIIVEGVLDSAGTPVVYGAGILTDNALLDIAADEPEANLYGTPTIYYSSKVLQDIIDRLGSSGGGGSSSGIVVARISY